MLHCFTCDSRDVGTENWNFPAWCHTWNNCSHQFALAAFEFVNVVLPHMTCNREQVGECPTFSERKIRWRVSGPTCKTVVSLQVQGDNFNCVCNCLVAFCVLRQHYLPGKCSACSMCSVCWKQKVCSPLASR